MSSISYLTANDIETDLPGIVYRITRNAKLVQKLNIKTDTEVQKVRSEGSKIEWENKNVLLYLSIGLRKSSRLMGQSAVDYPNSWL